MGYITLCIHYLFSCLFPYYTVSCLREGSKFLYFYLEHLVVMGAQYRFLVDWINSNYKCSKFHMPVSERSISENLNKSTINLAAGGPRA